MSIIADFVGKVIAIHKTGAATEHSYRPALEALLNQLVDGVSAVNEPKRVECGAPDFIIQRGELVIGHVEAKDLHISLRAMKGREKEQQERYRKALPNLIYTNCLDWDFYRQGELVASVRIADFLLGIQPKPDQYQPLQNLLQEFLAQRAQPITTPRELAERMAAKTALIKNVLHALLLSDVDESTRLSGEFKAFREQLIHDITPEDFADLYAETIAYGLFAARLHDPSPHTFNRREALELLPRSNPFLRSFFGYVAGPELDDRVKWIIDDLAAVFQVADMRAIMAGFGELTGQSDPFLHFYETFLAAYNPAKRKARGVWYTPEAVVNFIVRSVDQVLQQEFGLPDGLADTSQVSIDWDTGQTDAKGQTVMVKKSVHRVQVLDPATGTGTFLAEVIKRIAPKIKDIAPGQWSSYIEQHLIPRLHGFELLMASYAMCHLKLDMILTELGYQSTRDPQATPPRLSVYLTNSLEEGQREVRDLFMAQWLTREARAANDIKRQTPIMCVIGNPPYSGISQNMAPWITGLIEDYKYVDGQHFGERKHWLHDDYVKFIRLAEYLIEKNGEGVIGFITNHGYLDNPTFRGMRWHLLNTFDKVYVLDLHGNAKKKEVTPQGKPDKNVFDIQQGVAILIAVKKRRKSKGAKPLAQVLHGDLWGQREEKYRHLFDGDLPGLVTQKIDCVAPQFFFTPRDNKLDAVYRNGFGVQELMPVNVTGIVTARDGLVIDFSEEELKNKITRFADSTKTDEAVRSEFFPGKQPGKYAAGDSRGWKLPAARKSLQSSGWQADIHPVAYRPFDTRAMLYRPDMVDWGRTEIMRHMLAGENIGLATARSNKNPTMDHFFCTNTVMETKCAESSTQSALFPLYLYPTEQDLDQHRRVNFNPELYARIQTLARHKKHGTPDEVQVFDYVYGVLHCPAYRQTYAEFLKSDFPRIPWPATPDEFWAVSAQGATLRRLHLMDPATVGAAPYPFRGEGRGVVERPRLDAGKIWINTTQYFDAVPDGAWDFYIGGYQPAQKWLKDRKGRALSFDDVRHYQRILKVLSETRRVMAEIQLTLPA